MFCDDPKQLFYNFWDLGLLGDRAYLYWSMTTLTTVGYGDLIPGSDRERAYTCVAMVVGGGFYGYIIGDTLLPEDRLVTELGCWPLFKMLHPSQWLPTS